MKKILKLKNVQDAEVLANNRTEAGTRLREIRVRFWRTSNQAFFVFLILFPFYFLLNPYPAHAESFRISPAILKIELAPGKVTEQKITIDNLLDSPLPLKATIEGFDASDEENGIKVTDQVITSPLTNWIKLDNEDSIIPAKSSQTFTATITVPDQVPFGGYYAVIFFSPVLSPLELSTNNQIGAKVGVLALANIGVTNKENDANILNFDLDKTFYNKENPTALLRVKNTSLNFFTAKPTLTIKPLFGQKEVIEWEEKTILPGKVRRWEKAITFKNKTDIFYKVSLSVSLENGQFIHKTNYFWHLPKNKFLSFGAFLLLFLLIFRGRLNIKKAFRELFKSDQ